MTAFLVSCRTFFLTRPTLFHHLSESAGSKKENFSYLEFLHDDDDDREGSS